MQIILKMTTACNLNCVYCSEGNQPAKTLPEEIFFKLVDELPPLLEQVGTKDAEFLFHGGEPMLYGRDKLQTLIDDEWIKFFKAEGISPGVSLDDYRRRR